MGSLLNIFTDLDLDIVQQISSSYPEEARSPPLLCQARPRQSCGAGTRRSGSRVLGQEYCEAIGRMLPTQSGPHSNHQTSGSGTENHLIVTGGGRQLRDQHHQGHHHQAGHPLVQQLHDPDGERYDCLGIVERTDGLWR